MAVLRSVACSETCSQSEWPLLLGDGHCLCSAGKAVSDVAKLVRRAALAP